jgi:hypothetical protein
MSAEECALLHQLLHTGKLLVLMLLFDTRSTYKTV